MVNNCIYTEVARGDTMTYFTNHVMPIIPAIIGLAFGGGLLWYALAGRGEKKKR
jgi:hypothetical protein